MAAQTASMRQEKPLPLDDIGERWERFSETPADAIPERVLCEHEDVEARRDLLTSWLAFELDYSRWWNRREQLESKPLWEVLDADVFERVGRNGERALLLIARSTGGRLEPNMHAKSALAAIALWRNAKLPAVRSEAEQILRARPLPDDDWWLHRIAGRFMALGAARGTDRRPGLFQLAALQLGSRHWDYAARLGGMYLVQKCLPVGMAPDRSRLVEACDRAAERHWEREGDWLELLADAAVHGELRYAWLEKPVAACIRRAVDDPERGEWLRSYHRRRLYEADRARLDELYGHLLEANLESPTETRTWARRQLLEEIDQTAAENPRRALRLAELVAIHEHPLRFGTFPRRIRHALRQIRNKPALDLFDQYLAGLYVASYDVEPYALRFVDRLSDRIDWEANPVASPGQLDRYREVSDDDRAFDDLTFEIDGATLGIGDKEAAVRVRHFREKRVERSSIIRILRRMLAPVDWLGSTLRTTDPYEDALEYGIQLLWKWFAGRDERDRVVAEYDDAGLAVAEFEDLAEIDADVIDDYTERLGDQRLIVGTAAGVAVGALGPFGPRALALADIPVKAALSAEISARFCWYYGFDLREYPGLPREILGVALETDRRAEFESEGPDATLAELAIQTSLFVESVGSRNLGPFAGRALRGVIEQLTDSGHADAVAASAGRLARLALDSQSSKSEMAPLLGALAGGILGGALVYEVSNSARALLADRFLARKYDDWVAKI